MTKPTAFFLAALLLAGTSRAEDAPPAHEPPAAPAPAEPATEPETFTLTVSAAAEPKEGGKHAVQITGATTLPDQAIVQCHLYVTFTGPDGKERPHFIDGRSGAVKDGKLTVTMGPYVMAPGTYRVDALVDPHRQYPDVQKRLEGKPDIRTACPFQIGSDQEILEEREFGRPRLLRAAEQFMALAPELLDHSRDLQGPFEKGDWEVRWVEQVRRWRHRLTPTPGRVVGQNQVSRPLAERYDEAEEALFDTARALLKGYEAASGQAAKSEEGDPAPWPGEPTAAALQAQLSKALDILAFNYRQDLLMRLEGTLKNAQATYQAVLEEAAAPADAPPRRRIPAKELWATNYPKWLDDGRLLREELNLLTDPESPSAFVKQMARRLTGSREAVLPLAQDVETVVQGLGKALASGKPPAEEVATAIDRFYASYALCLVTQLEGAPR